MKNQIAQFWFAIIAFVALTLLMSYARPVADEPKQYLIVYGTGATATKQKESLEKAVSDKLAEGWHLQGGVGSNATTLYVQAMIK